MKRTHTGSKSSSKPKTKKSKKNTNVNFGTLPTDLHGEILKFTDTLTKKQNTTLKATLKEVVDEWKYPNSYVYLNPVTVLVGYPINANKALEILARAHVAHSGDLELSKFDPNFFITDIDRKFVKIHNTAFTTRLIRSGFRESEAEQILVMGRVYDYEGSIIFGMEIEPLEPVNTGILKKLEKFLGTSKKYITFTHG